jgi:hypothetical protein
MSHNLLFNASFHLLLNTIDQELAQAVQEAGCVCGGKLHRANYPRSPSGLLPPFRPHYEERFSFCCDNCRKRTTSQSVRFFGRRWFPAPVHLLISLLRLGVNERRLMQVKQHFGITVSESTWKRWRRWWRDVFSTTSFWKKYQGSIATAMKESLPCPRALWGAFRDKKMRGLLCFLAPCTAGILRAI